MLANANKLNYDNKFYFATLRNTFSKIFNLKTTGLSYLYIACSGVRLDALIIDIHKH